MRRGLDDGTERLRGQFRDASQRGRRDDGYGGDQVEDAAWKGVRWGSRGVELLLRKKKGDSKAADAEASPDTGFPEAEPPIETPPPPTDGRERVRIKTREAAPRQAGGSRSAYRQPSPTDRSERIQIKARDVAPHQSPTSRVPATAETPQRRSEPLKIKTRDAVQRNAVRSGTKSIPADVLAVDEPPQIRTTLQHDKTGTTYCHMDSTAPLTIERDVPSTSRQEPRAKGSRQPFADIKTKDSYIHRQQPIFSDAMQGVTPASGPVQKMKRSLFQRKAGPPTEKPTQASTQGEREFIQAQGRKKAVKQSERQRSRRKESLRRPDRGMTASPQGRGTEESFSRPHSPASPVASQSGFFPADGRAERGKEKPLPGSASKKKNAIKETKYSLKPSRHAARRTVKTAERSAKTAQAAQASAKAPQRAVQAVRATAKAGAATARGVGKASLSAIKKAVAAARELAAAIMAGGWVVAVITLIICIVGLLVTSPFGLFFSDPGSGMTIPEAVAQLNGEFTDQIEQIKIDNPYDTLDMDESGVAAVTDNWINVLAVYSVRVSSGDGTGASILTSENLAVLRETFWDMTEITYATETVEHEDEDDEIILHISVTTKTAQQIADEYGFTEEQKALLEEMLKPEYRELFQTLIGSSQSITLSPQEVQGILSRLPDNLSEQRRQVVLTAYQLLGKVNYFWGGKSLVLGWDFRWGTPREVWAAGSPSTGTIRPYGLDCSGFVDWVFYNVSGGSYIIGHGGGASAQHSCCTSITWADAQPGDLVFYPGDSHVGIVCGFDSGGNIQIIHCASGSNNVVVTGKIGFTTIGRPNYYS